MSHITALRAALEALLQHDRANGEYLHQEAHDIIVAALAATAAREQSSASIIQTILDLTRPMQGKDRNQPGWHIDSGWNSALLQVADVLRTLLAPLPQQAAPEQATPEFVLLDTNSGHYPRVVIGFESLDQAVACRDAMLDAGIPSPQQRDATTQQAIPAGQEPVAVVRVMRTGGNAGIAWHAEPLPNAPMMVDGDKLYLAAPPPPVAQQEDAKDADYKRLYEELIYGVGLKWAGETRHQTALRYIHRAEHVDTSLAAIAAAQKGDAS